MATRQDLPTGQDLRTAREAKGVGLGTLAKKIGRDKGHLSRVERGVDQRDVTHALVRDYERALGVTVAATPEAAPQQPEHDVATSSVGGNAGPSDSGQMGAAVADGTPLTSPDLEDSRLWVPSETVEVVSRFTREDLSLDRRQVVHEIAGAIFGTALLERLERWLAADTKPTDNGRASGVGYQEVEQIENAARLFRNWDHQFGGGLRRKAVVGQLSEVADELRDYSHPQELRRRLFGAMAQLAETAATMSWDSGRGGAAQRYYTMALRAAKESGDHAFGANILAGMARQLLYLGRTNEALELVRLAQAGAEGHMTPAVRAMLKTREAWAYAKHQRIGAFRRATSKAEDAFAETRRDEEPYWIDYFDQAELAGVTGGRLLDLAHDRPELVDETAAHIGRAIDLRSAHSLRSAALDQIGLAETRLVEGELEEGARLGHEAVDVVTQTQSDRVRVKLAEFYVHTDRHAGLPAVAKLRDRIRGLLTIQPV